MRKNHFHLAESKRKTPMWQLWHQATLTRLSCVLVFLGSLSIGTPALSVAQDKNATPEDRLIQEVAGLRKAVERVTLLLDELAKTQRLDGLFKRIELKERRLAPIEAELRAARRELVTQQELMTRLNANLDDLENRFREESQSGSDDPEKESDYKVMSQDLEAQINAKGTALTALESRIRTLENDLNEGRAELRGFEDHLQQALTSKERTGP
jgi:chromosome segregation ATPase